jgi:hypothetical protein
VWGVAIYLWSGLLYFLQVTAALRRSRPVRSGGRPVS